MTTDLHLVMQDLEHSRRRKKRSVLSKFAASSKQNILNRTVDSLDSTGDDQISHSDDFGLDGSQPHSNKPKYSQLESDDDGLDYLNDCEEGEDTQPNLSNSKKTGLDVEDDNFSGDDDDANFATRQSLSKLSEDIEKHDPSTDMDDLSPKLSPRKEQQQQHQSLNGGDDIISDSEDEDLLERDEQGASASTAKLDKRSVPSAAAVPPLSTVHSADEDEADDQPPQAESATSTISSAMMKVYGLFTHSSQAPSESSIVSASVTKISTKDARNRFVLFYRFAVFTEICPYFCSEEYLWHIGIPGFPLVLKSPKI